MASMQGLMTTIPRGEFRFKLGREATSNYTSNCPYSVYPASQSEYSVSYSEFPVLRSLARIHGIFRMAENQAVFSFHGGKQVIAHGRPIYTNLAQNEPLVAGAGARVKRANPSLKTHGKDAYLGQGLHSTKDGLGFNNLSTAFQTYLRDLEAQIRTVSNENYELKKDFTLLFALVNETNIEVRRINAKVPVQVASLVEAKLDNLDAIMLEIYGTTMVAVENLKEMRKDINELAAETKGKKNCIPK